MNMHFVTPTQTLPSPTVEPEASANQPSTHNAYKTILPFKGHGNPGQKDMETLLKNELAELANLPSLALETRLEELSIRISQCLEARKGLLLEESLAKLLKLSAQAIADASAKCLSLEGAVAESHAENTRLTERLAAESDYLQSEIELRHAHGEVIGRSPGIKHVLHQVEQVATAECSVLVSGETGTGKELIAREIHKSSARKGRMMVLVNCAALPSALVESELFGRERGAYTGA